VLAEDLVIEGDVTSSGPIDLQGKVLGSVRAPAVVVTATGNLDGTVTSLDLSVIGAITGKAAASAVSLAATAMVQADVTHERIAIESGAQIEGRLIRRR